MELAFASCKPPLWEGDTELNASAITVNLLDIQIGLLK